MCTHDENSPLVGFGSTNERQASDNRQIATRHHPD